MATIGSLWINVKSNTTGLSKGLGKAKGMLGKFGKFAASPAGIAVAAFAALTAGIVVMTKVLGGAVREFMAFEAGMAEVKSILLDVSDSDFARLEDSAKQLGATTAFTAEAASGGMANLARAGFDTNEILAATPAVLNLASATGMELAEAANIAAVAVRGFGLEATETAHVADVLALAASKTNTTVQEMGDAMSYVAPVANQLGFSIEETSAMLGKLADAGIKGSKGGTALRTMMLKLGSTIEKEGTQAFYDYLEAQHSVTENMEKFGKIGVTAAGVLSGVVDETEELTTAMIEAKDVVDNMAEARLDTLQGDITLFQSAVSGLKTEIGEKLAPTLREVVQVATTFIGGLQAAFSSVFEGVEGSIISTETLTNVFKTLGFIIFAIIGIADSMYNKIAFGFNTLKMVAAGVLTGVSAIIQAIVEAVSWGLNAVGLMSDDTYDATVGFMRDLTTELASMTAESAVDMGGNFMQGFAGGAQRDAMEMYDTFSDSMDGVGKAGGESLTEGMAESIEEGTPKVTAALETLTEEQEKLIASGTKLTENLQDQITYFGMSAAETLIAKAAKEGLTSATIEGTLALEQQLQALKDKVTAEEEASKKSEELANAAKKIIESLRTPQEIYDAEAASLQKMMDKKLLTLEQFEKALEKLREDTEEDIEVNIITKGIVEGLSTALGSVKISGQVDKTEQLAQKSIDVQQEIETVMSAVKENTEQNLTAVEENALAVKAGISTSEKIRDLLVEQNQKMSIADTSEETWDAIVAGLGDISGKLQSLTEKIVSGLEKMAGVFVSTMNNVQVVTNDKPVSKQQVEISTDSVLSQPVEKVVSNDSSVEWLDSVAGAVGNAMDSVTSALSFEGLTDSVAGAVGNAMDSVVTSIGDMFMNVEVIGLQSMIDSILTSIDNITADNSIDTDGTLKVEVIDLQSKIDSILTSIDNISIENSIDINETLKVEVLDLQSMVDSVVTSIDNIRNDNLQGATEQSAQKALAIANNMEALTSAISSTTSESAESSSVTASKTNGILSKLGNLSVGISWGGLQNIITNGVESATLNVPTSDMSHTEYLLGEVRAANWQELTELKTQTAIMSGGGGSPLT